MDISQGWDRKTHVHYLVEVTGMLAQPQARSHAGTVAAATGQAESPRANKRRDKSQGSQVPERGQRAWKAGGTAAGLHQRSSDAQSLSPQTRAGDACKQASGLSRAGGFFALALNP